MIYSAKIKKRLKYSRVYTVLKRTGGRENALTRLFMKALKQDKV
jgi:hypothetical protein